MHHLGISVYPDKSIPERDESYLAVAERQGFDRLFTNLLGVAESPQETVETFTAFMRQAHGHGFRVAVDTNPSVLAQLGATPDDLSVFHEMGIDTLRLDWSLGPEGDIAATRNPYGISIQFNASSMLALDNLIARGADPLNMDVCHNFFPERYTGLSEERFGEFSRRWRNMGLRISAFVSSGEPDAFGPWEVSCGLPTLEDDRERPIDLQLRHLLATGLVDDVLVGNCYASEGELAAMAGVDRTQVTLRVDVAPDATADEREVIWGYRHETRTDASAYLLRSSRQRERYRDHPLPARAVSDGLFHRGDVLVVNDNLAHYRGELEVALRDMPDDGTRNLVGWVPPSERFLLDYIRPGHPFAFLRLRS